MTHEAGIEAAQKLAIETIKNWNAWTPEKGVGDMLQEVFQAYLSASGMVLVPRVATAFMSSNLHAYGVPHEDVQEAYKLLIDSAPDPFKSK